MSDHTQIHDMVVTRVFDAPLEAVWKAWTKSEGLICWWGPTGFTCPSAAMNFREGGTSLVCMRAPAEFGGQDMFNTWTYHKIVPMERVEFVMGFADKDGQPIDPTSIGLPPEMPHNVRQVLALKALGSGSTELTVTEYGFPTEQLAAMSRGGLEQCLDKLAACLAQH